MGRKVYRLHIWVRSGFMFQDECIALNEYEVSRYVDRYFPGAIKFTILWERPAEESDLT